MTDAPCPNEEPEWVEINRHADVERAHEHALVVLAMGHACWVSPMPEGGFGLAVEAGRQEAVRAEIHAYESERQPAVQPGQGAKEFFSHPAGWALHVSWVLVLVAMFGWRCMDPGIISQASSSNLAIWERGEWWRPFTALFLHADVGHLVGNLVAGTAFATLCARMIGPLRTWIAILACGTLGNLLASRLSYPEPVSSIGFSTAVFAALGLLCGFGFAARRKVPDLSRSWAKKAAPLLGGLVMLGWLGTGGTQNAGQTDVTGHLAGFTVGLVATFLPGVPRGFLSNKTNDI